MVFLKAFPSGPYQTNAYIIACPDSLLAAIIDPAPGSAAAIQTYLKTHSLKAIYILLTHTHWDHITDVAEVKKNNDLKVCVHPLDRPNLESPGADGLPFFTPIPAVTPDIELNDGDIIKVGTISLQVIHTPGHSPGCICFYDKENRYLISGDTVFNGAIGNLSFPTSRPDLIDNSLEKLARLPPETIVYPGHGRSTTIGNESPSWEL